MRAAGRASLRDAIVLGLVFTALAVAAIHLAREPGSVAMIWFANAVGMAFLASSAPAQRPSLVIAMVIGNLVANLLFVDSLPLAVGFSVANAAEAMLGAVLIRRTLHGRSMIESPGVFFATLLAGGLVPQLLGATLGGATLHGVGVAPFQTVWLDWYAGNALGAIAFLPLALTWRELGGQAAKRELLSVPFVAAVLLLTGLSLVAYSWLPYPFVFAIAPVIVGALVLTPLGSFALCAVLCMTFSLAVSLALLAPTATLFLSSPLLLLVPALLSVLPAMLLTVVQAQQHRATRSLAALSSAAVNLMVFFDTDGRVRVVNRAWQRYWQRDAEEVVGLSVMELVPPEMRTAAMRDRIARALAGETISSRVEQPFPTLGVRSIEYAYQPAFGPDGRRVGVVFSAHDVTDLMSAQGELEQRVADLRAANESLEQFARITAHDLREPLNTVMQFSGLIQETHRGELSEPVWRYLGIVHHGAARMRVMLDDLMQFVRMESPDALVLEPVALDQCLADVTEALTVQIQSRGAIVEVGELPGVLGHPGLLSILFQNLVSNAIKFVEPGRTPRVTVGARSEGDSVIVTVEDNGIGIAEVDRTRLFTPFTRLHARRRFEGTGLGLAICKRAATAMGGHIEIAPATGRGTRFVVTLQRPT